jgi:hypothetical protein
MPKFSSAVRNAMADAVETAIGTAPRLRLFSGTAPAAVTDAATGTLLADLALPSDWMAAAAAGAKTLLGTWQDSAADGTGTAGYYRITDTAGTTTHVQGPVSATGGGGEIQLQNTSIAVGQQVTITAFTITAGNA